MTPHAWVTLLVVAAAVYAMALDYLPTVVAILVANIVLLVTGVIDANQAFSGFANPAVATVAALLVLARAVDKTGAMQPLLDKAVGHRDEGRGTLLRLIAPVSGVSAFLNNTPIVATLAPPVMNWARRNGFSATVFLMPLNFAVIMGGTVTLIGTSTNLVVSGLLTDRHMSPLGMFELTPVGLPMTIAGLFVLFVFSHRLLPKRRSPIQQFEEGIREFVYQSIVERSGPFDGYSVEAAGLRRLEGVFLVSIERDGRAITPATPETVLRGGDCLTFAGRVDIIRDLQSRRGLRPLVDDSTIFLDQPGHTFFEAIVGGSSPLVGQTLQDADFRGRYQAAVVAIHRAGQRVVNKLGTERIKDGDALLIVADDGFRKRWHNRSDFALIATLGGSLPISKGKAVFVGLLAFMVVVCAGVGLLPILQASLVGCALLVLTRVISHTEARDALDIDTLITIAASFGIGAAIEQSRLADYVATLITGFGGAAGPAFVLFLIILATVTVTQVITNNAAAVLVFPIAIAAAEQLHIDPRGFVVALTIAASCSFLTPIGYQTNTLVYGLAGYRFGDFFRLGLPLTIVSILIIQLLVPLFFPF